MMDPFDAATMAALHSVVRDLDAVSEPTMRAFGPLRASARVALLPGSFNPPTAAHVVLAERALSMGYDIVAFVYTRATVGKDPYGLVPEDRLAALRALESDRFVVVACSHGLYADQAAAAARLFGDAEVAFLVGADKVIQIFEHQWYEDRDRALDRLFSAAKLLVAPRADLNDELAAVLAAPENASWAPSIEQIHLHPAVAELSSTRARGLLRAGSDPSPLVPPPVRAVLDELRAFAPPLELPDGAFEPYRLRERLLAVTWRASDADLARADLRALFARACSATDDGRVLRAALNDEDASLAAILDRVRR